jgi:hypothetical protein
MAGGGAVMHYENQHLVQKVHGERLATLLREFEYDHEPHGTLVTALNCLLVWTGARPATLPAWKYCNTDSVHDFLAYLNEISQRLNHPRPAEIIIYERPQMYRSRDVTVQRLVTLRGKTGISFDPNSIVGDAQIGRELGMYEPNTKAFAEGHDLSHLAFSVWEAGVDALMYAEAWDEKFLSVEQRQEFLRRCQELVHQWNEIMKGLGLEYRFYGTMDWRRQETPFVEAKNTQRFYGKTHLGYDSRAPISNGHSIGLPQVNFISQSPQWTHAVRG